MKVIYTKSAEKELEVFLDAQKDKLEKEIAWEKSVFGDDLVEITANDIKKIEKLVVYVNNNRRFMPRTRILSSIYISMGILISVGAIAYDSLRNLFIQNQIQFLILTVGLLLLTTGIFARQYSNLYEKRVFRGSSKPEKIDDFDNRI